MDELLPEESWRIEYVRNNYERELNYARKCLEVAIELVSGSEGILRIHTRGLGRRRVVDVTLNLFQKACTIHRSVIVSCQLGLKSEAETLVRSEFETFLLLDFLLRHRVVLKRNGKACNPPSPLTTLLRTNLYIAHYLLEWTKLVRQCRDEPGLKRIGHGVNVEGTLEALRKVEGELGSDWTWILRHPRGTKTRKSYDVFSARNLAESLGHMQGYVLVYKYWSLHVHGHDVLMDHFYDRRGEALAFFLQEPKVGSILRTSGGTLAFAALAVNKRFKLGLENKIEPLVKRRNNEWLVDD